MIIDSEESGSWIKNLDKSPTYSKKVQITAGRTETNSFWKITFEARIRDSVPGRKTPTSAQTKAYVSRHYVPVYMY